MKAPPPTFASGAAAERIAAQFPSFRDFVDDALFHPAWGYYSTGQVRFGDGGHYDTFPISLSPVFGQMVAQYAYRFWRRAGLPRQFEICELGGGNGQLCLDTLVSVSQRAATAPAWRQFATALRYRIVERSPALIARQRQHLGPLATSVTWLEADLTQQPVAGVPFAPCGLVFANEVLDCLSHHKIVPHADGAPGVVFVVPKLRRQGTARAAQEIPRAQLATVLADDRLRRRVSFQEVVLPIEVVPHVAAFVRYHYPEFFRARRKFQTYFACPEIQVLIRNAAQLYPVSKGLWIDYGDRREFHLMTREARRVFAGPPNSGASVYRAPGRDDITFMVDFSVVEAAAYRADWQVEYFGGQGELARRSGVQFDRPAIDLILQQRTLSWVLALMGLGPERAWRHSGLTWDKRAGKGGRLRDDVRKGVAEFMGRRSSPFKLMILRPARRAGAHVARFSRPVDSVSQNPSTETR